MTQLRILSYGGGWNIGDEIQSLAVAECLPRVDGYADRNHLRDYNGPPATVFLNGWFSGEPDSSWPPSSNIKPAFVGFHMTNEGRQKFATTVDYFRKHIPIGCRDSATTRQMIKWGVEASTTYCATLTFRRRTAPPAHGVIAVVDAADIVLPNAVKRKRVQLSHLAFPDMNVSTKMSYAREIIDFYRERVELAITTRLHCALPCIALGIPVVFFGDRRDIRLTTLSELGVPIYDKRSHMRGIHALKKFVIPPVEWWPRPVDVEHIGEQIRSEIQDRST